MFGFLSRFAGNARQCCIATSAETEHRRASFLAYETTGPEQSLGTRGSRLKGNQFSKPRRLNMWRPTDSLQTSASIRNSPLYRSNKNTEQNKKRERRKTSTSPFMV